MLFVTRPRLWLGVVATMGLVLAGCAADGTDDGGGGSSFALTSCDSAEQCPAGFECAGFPCGADCAADSSGRCDDACQAGPICLPQPPAACDPALCPAGQVCTRACSGACDATTGQCTDVACQIACQPVTTPTEPPPNQGCVTDFTDACLPPGYPVAARLDDVCAAQGMVLTDVSVAAECWPGAVQFKWTCCRGDEPIPPEPWCERVCYDDGACWEQCCDATGQCWETGHPTEPTEVCLSGANKECQPGVDPKMQAYDECAAQNLELRDLTQVGACPDGMPMFVWTCCGAGVVQPPPPVCDKRCDDAGVCTETCCDPTTGACTDPNPPTTQCTTTCDAANTCTETCCDANGQCTTKTWPDEPVPPDPHACVAQVAGGDGTCTDLETLLAYASWTCAASGLTLADNGPWGACDGGYQGLRFSCCP